MTQYIIFTHYYNESVGKSVTNSVDCEWYAAMTNPNSYEPKEGGYGHSYLQLEDMNQSYLEENRETLETIYVSGKTKGTGSNSDTAIYEKLIVKNSSIDNPKYDMIFVWDGLGYFTSDNTPNYQLYFDKMKRIKFKPWFLHSIYLSLRAAMTNAQKLVNLFGKDNIMIGKEVALDQYIDIV